MEIKRENPYCPDCQVEMTEETAVTDYFDPNDYHGHGQTSEDVYECPNCKEVYDKAMFNEEEAE